MLISRLLTKVNETRRSRALAAGSLAILMYGLIILLMHLIPSLAELLDWLWLFISGPGFLLVSLFHPPSVESLDLVLMYSCSAAFWFIGVTLVAYNKNLRWVIIALWGVIAIISAVVGIFLSVIPMVELTQ